MSDNYERLKDHDCFVGEWVGKGSRSSGEEWDFDQDQILKPQYAGMPFGLAPVFASEVLVYIPSTGDIIPAQD